VTRCPDAARASIVSAVELPHCYGSHPIHALDVAKGAAADGTDARTVSRPGVELAKKDQSMRQLP